MAVSISRCITSSFESGRFDFTSSSHSSRNAISALLDTSSGKFDCCKKIRIGFPATLNFPFPFREFSLSKQDGSLGAGIHHEDVRTKLLQAPGEILAICVVVDESKKVQIPLCIAHNAFEIVNLKQAQVTMIILDSFLLELRALLRSELVSLAFLFGP